MSLLKINLNSIPRVKTFDDVLAKLDTNIYNKAAELGMSVPQYLECMLPSPEGELSTFDKCFKHMGIFVNGDAKRGITSSPASFFVPADSPQSAILFPAFIQQQAMIARLSAVSSVESLVATTRTITGSAYQALSIDDSGLAAGKSFRVGEGAPFPKVKFTWSSAGNVILKHGVQLDFSYEFLRRASIELVGTLVQRIAQRDAQLNYWDAITFLLNGDGSVNNPAAVSTTAKSYDNTIAADGVCTYTAWLKWLATWDTFRPNIIIGDIDAILAIVLMTRPAADTFAIISALKSGSLDPNAVKDLIDNGEQLFPNVKFHVVPTAKIGALTLLGIDTTAAAERIVEAGSDLTETQKYIERQTETMVMSVADNISKIWPGACKVLSLNNV
jgi:hypothetical protein